MWILRSSSASPFGRKVKIGAALCGLSDRITVEPANTADPTDSITTQNPLGKIPTLILEDGTILYDSRVIMEWLDHAAGGGVLLPEGGKRFTALTLQATADGIMDANVLIVAEGRFRPAEKHHQPWIDRQQEKASRALRMLNAAPPALSGKPHVGHIALACALGHRDFRFGGDWRSLYPRLVEWLAAFEAAVPSYGETRPH